MQIVWTSHKRWRMGYCSCQYIRRSLIGFGLMNLHLILAHSKGQGQGLTNIDCEYLVNGDIWPMLLLSIHEKSPICFWLVYLHLIMVHSKVQSHLQFDCEIFENRVMLHLAVCQRLRCPSLLFISVAMVRHLLPCVNVYAALPCYLYQLPWYDTYCRVLRTAFQLPYQEPQ